MLPTHCRLESCVPSKRGNQSKRPHSKTATTITATLSGITTRTATLLWSKRPHCFGQNGHISWVATKTATLFWSKRPHSFWSKRPHILSRGPPTGCHHCGQTLTIDHMLLECALLQECRDEYYTVDSLNALFETISETCIVEFLREAGFFYLI